MIKFKEYDGMLFRMLEEPEPLTEKNANVLVQFITHGIIGEYVMEHWLDCNQENVPIYIDDVDSDGDVTVWIDENINEHHCCPFPMFEIIGYPMADGSKDWALYQMMQGEKVCNPQLAKDKAARLGCDDETFNTFWYIVGDTVVEGKSNYGTLSVSSWIAASSSTGWQLYKEPEPEPAKEQFEVGDWVEVNANGVKKQGKIMRFCEDDFFQDNTNALVLHDVFDRWYGYHRVADITRKLSSSEIVVRIGCLSGTVRPVSAHGINMWFHLIDVDDKLIATIRISCLDSTTRELVESLLKAQEEEK